MTHRSVTAAGPCDELIKDIVEALRVIAQIRAHERAETEIPPLLASWRPRRPGCYAITLGVSARYGLHPSGLATCSFDRRLIPAICVMHRSVRAFTRRLRLPGRPIVCLSSGSISVVGLRLPRGQNDLAIAFFQSEKDAEMFLAVPLFRQGIFTRRPVVAERLAALPPVIGGSLGALPATPNCAIVAVRIDYHESGSGMMLRFPGRGGNDGCQESCSR